MIVGQKKPLNEIWEMVQGYKKILVLGCDTCVAVCHEGGSPEALHIASELRDRARQAGLDMDIKAAGIERQCEHEYFERVKKQIEWADAVVSTACGAGIQFTNEKWPNKIVLPGLNTTFVGVVEAPEIFTERCLMCGDCILHLTGGICPITLCSKSIMNGPCGGSGNGICEIDKRVPCAWQMIYDRLKLQGRLELLEEIIPAKNWSPSRYGGPRRLVKGREAPQKENDPCRK